MSCRNESRPSLIQMLGPAGVARWFELGGDNNDPHKYKYFSLYFTPDLLSKLSKSRRTTAPPPSYAYGTSTCSDYQDLAIVESCEQGPPAVVRSCDSRVAISPPPYSPVIR